MFWSSFGIDLSEERKCLTPVELCILCIYLLWILWGYTFTSRRYLISTLDAYDAKIIVLPHVTGTKRVCIRRICTRQRAHILNIIQVHPHYDYWYTTDPNCYQENDQTGSSMSSIFDIGARVWSCPKSDAARWRLSMDMWSLCRRYKPRHNKLLHASWRQRVD